MPMNNNPKGQSAADRLAKLPVLRSACTKLSLLYSGTKCSHPNLRAVCEGLESSVTAVLSPVIVKLEPQICFANDIACRSLDWLETTFPVLRTPTEQIVATAKNKMHELQDVVSIAANGSVDCVHMATTWLVGRIQQADDQADQPLLERAISAASMGLDFVLIISEALMDRMLPPPEENKEVVAAHKQLGGFEVATPRSYPVRLISLAVELYRRTSYMVMENLSRSSVLVQELQTCCQTLAWNIQGLPQYVQHQLVSAFFFIAQMYNLRCPQSHRYQSNNDTYLNAMEISARKEVVQFHQEAAPPTYRMRKPTKMPVFDHRCNIKGCVGR